MSIQTIKTPSGETMVVLPLTEYERLLDAADGALADQISRDIEAGQSELVPSRVVDRLLAGDHVIRVWREYRGLTAKSLAAAAGISAAYLSEIESGRKEGSISTLKAIASALSLDLDDII